MKVIMHRDLTSSAKINVNNIVQDDVASPSKANIPSVSVVLSEPSQIWVETKWSELIPKNWDPAIEFRKLDYSNLQDGDPMAMKLLEKMRKKWDEAPANTLLDGKKIKIPGFVVPLEKKDKKISEYLIVPYFGACIHSPPPPANQIIIAYSEKVQSDIEMMATVWTYGTIRVNRATTEWGTSAYRIDVDKIEKFQ